LVAINDPKLLERRTPIGPIAEKEILQKIIVSIVFLTFIGAVSISAIGHHFGWSHMPFALVFMGDVLISLSYLCFFFVYKENTYGAATIRVE
jgi:protein-S-isoprenylcysteine O-methyltransferase Ste14